MQLKAIHLIEDKLKRYGYHIARDWSRIGPEASDNLRRLLHENSAASDSAIACGTVRLRKVFIWQKVFI